MSEQQVHAAFIEQDEATLRLNLAACRLRVAPGPVQPWVSGTYRDPGDAQSLQQRVGGSELAFRQQRSLASAAGMLRGAPFCDLRLGTARPYHLVIDSGASDVDLDLGGLPLRSLELRIGAGRVDLRVDRPNPVDAEEVSLQVGAGALLTSGLGNLAATSLRVDVGAASVGLGLDGELRRSLSVRISSAASAFRLTLPADRPVRISSETVLAGIDLGDGFLTRDGAFLTLAEGEPVVTVDANIRLGSLQLRTTSAPG